MGISLLCRDYQENDSVKIYSDRCTSFVIIALKSF